MLHATELAPIRLLFGFLFQAPSRSGEQTGYYVAVLDNRQKRGRAVGTRIG